MSTLASGATALGSVVTLLRCDSFPRSPNGEGHAGNLQVHKQRLAVWTECQARKFLLLKSWRDVPFQVEDSSLWCQHSEVVRVIVVFADDEVAAGEADVVRHIQDRRVVGVEHQG